MRTGHCAVNVNDILLLVVQLMDELSKNLNVTMLSSHRVDDDKTHAIDEMQQYVSVSMIAVLIFHLMTFLLRVVLWSA